MKCMSRAHAGWIVVLSLVVSHTHSRAQDGPPPINTTRSISAGADDDIITEGDRNTTEPQHAEGTYMGVAPGSEAQPPAAIAAHKGPATITWPGFQMRPDGSSRVFVQSTTALELQPTAAPGKYALHLPRAHVSGGTNRLPLDTRFFNTPVTKVSLSSDRTGVTIVLELRAEVAPNVSSERGSAGYFFTYIDLPKGSYVANKPAGPAAKQFAPADETKHLDGDATHAQRNIEAETAPSFKAQAGIKLHN
jgi:hypothetical protein